LTIRLFFLNITYFPAQLLAIYDPEYAITGVFVNRSFTSVTTR
jgi:hypothetical protein